MREINTTFETVIERSTFVLYNDINHMQQKHKDGIPEKARLNFLPIAFEIDVW